MSLFSPTEKRLVLSSMEISQEEPDGIMYQHTVFCQTCLPYRNPGPDVRRWEKSQGNISLLINAGDVIDPLTNRFKNTGLPYGPKPRLILTHLNSEAMKNGNPLVEADSSLTAFVRRLGLAGSGRDIKVIKEQLTRLSTATIKLAFHQGGDALQFNSEIVKGFRLWKDAGEGQQAFWPGYVELSDDYFTSLMTHAVPLDERAVGSLSHSAMALDIYTWLAQRLHRVNPHKPQFIPWTALKEQFGGDYGRMSDFKKVFRKTIVVVKSQYQDAKFDLDGKGMALHNSLPPIRNKYHIRE